MGMSFEQFRANAYARSRSESYEKGRRGCFSIYFLGRQSLEDLNSLSEWLLDRRDRLQDERRKYLDDVGPKFYELSCAIYAARTQWKQVFEERRWRAGSFLDHC